MGCCENNIVEPCEILLQDIVESYMKVRRLLNSSILAFLQFSFHSYNSQLSNYEAVEAGDN